MTATQANGGTNANAIDPLVFEAERARYISGISQDVAQLITNVNVLNKNLETIINIGHEFEQLSQLWRHFHTSTLAFQDTASNESKQ